MSQHATEKWENRAAAYREIRRRGGQAAAEGYRARFRRLDKFDAALEVLGNWSGASKKAH